MTTKQQVQQEQSEIEAVTPELLLRRYRLLDKYIDQLRKNNTEAGLPSDKADAFAPRLKLLQQDKISRFIRNTTNPKTGKWFSISGLKAGGIISDIEESQYTEKEFPSFRLYRLARILSGKKEWLQRFITISSLDKNGNVVSVNVSDIDYYHIPTVRFESIPSDDSNEGSNQIRVGKIMDAGRGFEPSGPKIYLLPYYTEKVHQIIKDIPPIGSFEDRYHGCGLTFIKEGESNKAISVDSIEEFTSPDFVALFREKRQPAPVINVSSKALLKDAITGSELKQYQ